MFLRSLPLFLLLGSLPASASPGVCPSGEDRAHLTALRDRIAAAKTPEEAREMAFAQTRLGQLAIDRAARVLPENKELAAASARLDAFEAGVATSTTQQEVAGQFDRLVQTGTMAGNCDYTNTEIVIIVLGFIFGILPGILFLFLFC